MLSRGSFYCPDEGAERDYEIKTARRWFSIFYIPLIPRDELGTYLECGGCGQQYKESVLKSPTPESREKTYAAGLRAAMAVVLREHEGSAASHDQRLAAVEVVGGYLGEGSYDLETLDKDLVLDASDTNHALGELGAMLNAHGQEQVLRACLDVVSSADGANRLNLVSEVGETMGMRPAHSRGVIDEVADTR